MKLDPLVNQLVRFKLHESPESFEATILAFDETGYWVRGESHCAQSLQAEDTPYFLEFKRIRSIQKV
jgi:hypothetical protein